MISRGKLAGVGIMATALAVALVFVLARREPEPTPAPGPAPAATVRSEPAAAVANATSPAPLEDTAEPSAPVTAQTNSQTFRVNDSARLVIDEQTRLNMEALFARGDRSQLAEAKQEAVEPLPAGAQAQAAELLEQYDNYQQAQRQTYPPGVAPSTEEAALAELDGLHALRVAHFGPVVARALYGEEEAESRQLVELMRLEKDQSLTLEEKAVRAQQLRDSQQTDRQ